MGCASRHPRQFLLRAQWLWTASGPAVREGFLEEVVLGPVGLGDESPVSEGAPGQDRKGRWRGMWRGLTKLLWRHSLERMRGSFRGWRADKGGFGDRQTRAQTLALSYAACAVT